MAEVIPVSAAGSDKPAVEALINYASTITGLKSEVSDSIYTDLGYRLEDITDDGIPELFVGGFNVDGKEKSLEEIAIYTYDNGNVVNMWDSHCGGVNGFMISPASYFGYAYVYVYSYSSASGMRKKAIIITAFRHSYMKKQTLYQKPLHQSRLYP